ASGIPDGGRLRGRWRRRKSRRPLPLLLRSPGLAWPVQPPLECRDLRQAFTTQHTGLPHYKPHNQRPRKVSPLNRLPCGKGTEEPGTVTAESRLTTVLLRL